MPQPEFDVKRLTEPYDMDDPIAVAELQQTIFDFMAYVRNGSQNLEADASLIDLFCDLVKKEEHWPLTTSVVPEFRTTIEAQ